MKAKFFTRILTIFIFATLYGCATFQHQETLHKIDWKTRKVQLQSIHNWEITGSLGVIFRESSDVVSFGWAQNRQNYTIDIHGPMNIGATEIIGSAGNVSLRRSDTEEITANNPEKLLRKQFGWSLPIANLRYWIFALPAPIKIDEQQFDEYGHLVKLQQQGWIIEYSNFVCVNGIDLPSKIKMQNTALRIKLVLRTWKLNHNI